MARYRMWPTKANFPGRWPGTACNVCGFADTDVHLFTCPAYSDLNPDGVTLEMFWDEEVINNMDVLLPAAKCSHSIISRLEEVQRLF